jgi:hypothetical protein
MLAAQGNHIKTQKMRNASWYQTTFLVGQNKDTSKLEQKNICERRRTDRIRRNLYELGTLLNSRPDISKMGPLHTSEVHLFRVSHMHAASPFLTHAGL